MATHVEPTSAALDAVVVKIGTLGGSLQEIALPANATVADALQSAGYPTDAEVRCGGETYRGSDQVATNDVLIVLAGQKVRGGTR